MTFSNTPIEMQLQRNSSIILKQKNIREYLPPESTNMLRKFEVFRNNSLLDRKSCDSFSFSKVKRHSSEIVHGRQKPKNRKFLNLLNPPVRIIFVFINGYTLTSFLGLFSSKENERPIIR